MEAITLLWTGLLKHTANSLTLRFKLDVKISDTSYREPHVGGSIPSIPAHRDVAQ